MAQAEITETFGLPVTIDNEANLGALGEQQFGAGRGIPHLVYISAGIGIGTGLILNGALYKGASGYSGDHHEPDDRDDLARPRPRGRLLGGWFECHLRLSK